ncbi:MAG: sugar phosphate nucleotidyltransferase [Polyangiaceae bacterium]|nr:sugar phosphate nucleotidyltransferase [Polyangiaceae bacterium]
MQCVVLAGGLGTRMRPLTETVPKVLLPVLGVPFLDHQLRWLSTHGVTEVVLSVGYLGEMVEAHLAFATPPGLSVRIVHEGPTLLGTAGALRLACDRGYLAEEFLLTYGDSYLPVDFGAIGRAFRESGRAALMSVFKNDGRWDTSNVVYDAQRHLVTLYDKKRVLLPISEFRYIDYGLSAFARETVLREIPSSTKYDLAEVFQGLSLRGELAGAEVFERFYEVGSPQGLSDLEKHLEGGT